MDRLFIVKFTFALVVVCVEKCTSESTANQVNFIWRAEHWRGMTWFDSVNTRMGWKDKSELSCLGGSLMPVTKSRVIPLLMGCGYGKKFTDFLWLTTYTAMACKIMSEDGNDHARDCWTNLGDSIKRGALAMAKLLAAFVKIRSFDNKIRRHSLFYSTLLPIRSFLQEQDVENGLTETEARRFTEEIEDFAKSLGKLLNYTCRPTYDVISREQLMDEFQNQRTIQVLCDFYVDRMNSYTGYVDAHIFHIGFDFVPGTTEIDFSIPQRRG